MMDDVHTLAEQPNDALRIANLSARKNEALFIQWMYEVNDVLTRHPAGVVRSWMTRSQRGQVTG